MKGNNDMKTSKLHVLIYGTGNKCKQILNIDYFDEIVDVVAFIDSDVSKKGNNFADKTIINPSDIGQYSYDYILIASVYSDEIKNDLIKTYQIPINIIKEDGQNYLRNLSINKKFEIYEKDHIKKELIYNNKLVIYTAMFGDYDDLIEPTYISDNCDYVCYTDNKNLKSKIWDIILVQNNNSDNNRAAKEYKVLPHKFLQDYEYSIWVDANFEIVGDMRKLLLNYLGNQEIAFMFHPDRSCLYEEAEYCKVLKKDDESKINKQIDKYHKEGYPAHNGLIAGSCIIRKHNSLSIINLMELWWKEIGENSRRDQISFNYAAWKLKIDYSAIPINMFDNDYFKVIPHKG